MSDVHFFAVSMNRRRATDVPSSVVVMGSRKCRTFPGNARADSMNLVQYFDRAHDRGWLIRAEVGHLDALPLLGANGQKPVTAADGSCRRARWPVTFSFALRLAGMSIALASAATARDLGDIVLAPWTPFQN